MTRKPASADELFLRRAALRLGLQFSAIIFAIIALVGIVAFTLVSASIAESTDRSLTAATHDLRGDEAGAGTYVVTVRDGHLVSSKPLPDGLPDLGAIHDVGTNGGVIDSSVDSGQTSYAVRTLIAGGTVVDRKSVV